MVVKDALRLCRVPIQVLLVLVSYPAYGDPIHKVILAQKGCAREYEILRQEQRVTRSLVYMSPR